MQPNIDSPAAERAFTPRAILTGCLGAFGVSAGAAYGTNYLQGSFMALGTSMPGAVFLLFVLTLFINPLLKTIHPSAGLNRRELLVVYIMMVMASPIPTLFATRFLAIIAAPFYFATPENKWQDLIHPHLPDWLFPSDPRVAQSFYQGIGQGQSIPWEAWIPTFLAWAPFIWALFLVMITTMVLLRKQWVEHERLIYPLMQVPLAMTAPGKATDRLGPFFKNPVMWAGFALPALWGTLHGLYNYFPEIIPLAKDVDPVRMNVSIFHDIKDLFVAFRFNIIGFFYFLKTDIAFSLWFFNLLSFLVRGIFGILGIASTENLGVGHTVHNLILAHQAMGAMVVLLFGGLWTARNHLGAIGRKVFLGDASVDDSGEILSYRTATALFLASSLVLTGWLWLAGLPLWAALGLLFLVATILIGYTRVVAEGGLSDGAPPVVPAGILVSAVGSSALGDAGLVILGTSFFWTTSRSFVITSCANSLRLGEELGQQRKPLFWVIILALVVALGTGVWTVMTLAHKYGAINLWMIETSGDRRGFNLAARLIQTSHSAHGWTWINMGIGALIMSGLMVGRWLYAWWPFHPLGYIIGPIWIMDHLWFNVLLSWLFKVIVLKYGGVRLYMKTRPFFLGMILGYYTPGGFYLIIDHFTGMSRNVIFWG